MTSKNVSPINISHCYGDKERVHWVVAGLILINCNTVVIILLLQYKYNTNPVPRDIQFGQVENLD